MVLLDILKFPDKNLEILSEDVLFLNNFIFRSIHDMIETMFYYNGIGISAPQVNILKNIILININCNLNQVLVLLNPKIVYFSGFIMSSEGCLSFPGIFVNVKRSKNLFIKFISLDKKNKFIKADGLLSICIQHEIDHLFGITLYNKMSLFKKSIYFNKK